MNNENKIIIKDIPVLLEEALILLFLQCSQLIEILVLQTVLVCPVLSRDQGFLNQWLWVFGFLGDNSMLAEDIIPKYSTIIIRPCSQIAPTEAGRGYAGTMQIVLVGLYHSVSSLGLTSTSIANKEE